MRAVPEGKDAQTNEKSLDPEVTVETTKDTEVAKKEDQAEINKKNYNPVYAFFVLAIVLICRIMV